MTLFTGRSGRAALIALVAACAAPATHAAAQKAGANFVVALPDHYPAEDGAGFIVRTGDGRQPDMIVLNAAKLDAPTLTAAVAVLRRLRRGSVVPADRTEVTTVQGFAPFRNRTPRTVPALERALDALLKRPRARIGNLGSGRWLELPDDVLR